MTKHPENIEAVEREAARIATELDIPPCPATLARFDEEFHAPQPDLRRLAAVIGTDIGLSATMLKTVNSSFYGLAKKATSIEQALAILGLRASANLVSGLLLRRAFPASSGAAMERFWDSSLRIAGLATAIAARLMHGNSDEAHTYVLFRDCGMLVMLRKFPQYADIMERSAFIPGAQFTRIEDTQFKFNHARVACALARSWSLSEPLCGAILYHHDVALLDKNAPGAQPPDSKLIAFGLLAEQIAALHLNQGLCPDWIGAEEFVLATLGIGADDIVELTEQLLGVTA
ncbi:MAG: HDOD domain-containing protein [Burkholderiales bacterium]